MIEVIEHRRPDRVPIYGWVRANLEEQISEAFGSVEAFEDHYEFDFAHLFGRPWQYTKEDLAGLREKGGGEVLPGDLLDLPVHDPDDASIYEPIRKGIAHHKEERGRFVYVQTPGIFECLNGTFGIENHMMYLLLYPDELKAVYERQAGWNRTFAMNCIDLGVDMVHVSDDWGTQRGLMFRPETWREMIRPYHKITADAVKRRGVYLGLHCDGDFRQVVDGVLGLGYDVVHPWQESAGMPLEEFRRGYRDRLTVMGGLDVQATIGFGDFERLEREIERVLRMFADGGLLFCTTHFVQDHCSIEELRFAFDTVYRLTRELSGQEA